MFENLSPGWLYLAVLAVIAYFANSGDGGGNSGGGGFGGGDGGGCGGGDGGGC